MLARDTGKAPTIPITFHLSGDERRLTAAAELALYRIAQEGLRNVSRHAQATAAAVTLAFADKTVKLIVQDNGQGFVVPENPTERVATPFWAVRHSGTSGTDWGTNTITRRTWEWYNLNHCPAVVTNQPPCGLNGSPDSTQGLPDILTTVIK